MLLRDQNIMGHQLERLTHCLNCGQPTEGNFCSNCGQENEDQTASLKAVAEDFLDDVIHFDSRLVRTLLPLIFKPGLLTIEYNRGRRVSYLSPYRMYLFVSAVFFLLLAYSSSFKQIAIVNVTRDNGTQAGAKQSNEQQDAAIKQAAAELKANGIPVTITRSYAQNVAGVHLNVYTPNINSIINSAKHPNQASEVKSNTAVQEDDDDADGGTSHLDGTSSIFGQKIDLANLPKTVDQYDAIQTHLPVAKRDPGWVRNLKENIIQFKANPKLLESEILDYIPKMTFFLVPLYAASLYPMYLRRKRYYVEHLIYSLHTHSYVFIIFTLMLLPSLPAVQASPILHHTADFVSMLLLASIPVYLFVSMKRVYAQSPLKTLLKFGIAWSGYWVMLLLAFMTVVLAVLFAPSAG
jgi:hypothetical protein